MNPRSDPGGQRRSCPGAVLYDPLWGFGGRLPDVRAVLATSRHAADLACLAGVVRGSCRNRRRRDLNDQMRVAQTEASMPSEWSPRSVRNRDPRGEIAVEFAS